MSDNIVPTVAAAAVLETAAATPSAFTFNPEVAPFFTIEEFLALKAENERLKAENHELNTRLAEYEAADAYEELMVKEEAEAEAAVDAAEAAAEAKAKAEAVVGGSWGDEYPLEEQRDLSTRSTPLPAAARPARVMKAARAPLPKPTIKANRPWLFELKSLIQWLKAEMDKSPVEKKCSFGRNCTKPGCKFEHFCSYVAYKKSGKTVYQLECNKNPEVCNLVHHICDCSNKGCKAVHLDRLPESLEDFYSDSTA